mgnify:FL=1|jgi:hypothetical protein
MASGYELGSEQESALMDIAIVLFGRHIPALEGFATGYNDRASIYIDRT